MLQQDFLVSFFSVSQVCFFSVSFFSAAFFDPQHPMLHSSQNGLVGAVSHRVIIPRHDINVNPCAVKIAHSGPLRPRWPSEQEPC